MAECGKGWTERCAHAKSRKCTCRCGGDNHGKAVKQEEGGQPRDEINTVLSMVVEDTIRPLAFTPRVIERFAFEGLNGRQAQTHLTICGKVIIATERSDNPGASITNAAESLWAAVRERFGQDVVAIEHYPNDRGFPEDWDLVTIVDGEASWSSLTRERVASIIANPEALEVNEGVAVMAGA